VVAKADHVVLPGDGAFADCRGQLDAAPFLGVFFLLIIFLLLNSTFVFTPGVPISLPEGVNLPGPDKATAAVAVDEGGHYYFENQLCGEDHLRQRLQDAVSRRIASVGSMIEGRSRSSTRTSRGPYITTPRMVFDSSVRCSTCMPVNRVSACAGESLGRGVPAGNPTEG